mgnify:CR=1 FL=1
MPNLNKKSQQYLFKNKFYKGRKSKAELIKESSIMMSCSILLIFINYLIPQKSRFFNTFNNNLKGIFSNILEIIFYLTEVMIVVFIVFSFLTSVILIIGSLNRILKVILSKRKIRYR